MGSRSAAAHVRLRPEGSERFHHQLPALLWPCLYRTPGSLQRGGHVQFKSKDFEYTINNKRKGGWDIVIKPKDAGDVRQMALSISEDGYGSCRCSVITGSLSTSTAMLERGQR